MHFRFRIGLLLGTMMATLMPARCPAQTKELVAVQRLQLRGNYGESIAGYEQLLKQRPVQATLGLARCYWEQGQRQEAIERLERQLAKSPKSAELYAHRAWLALECGDFATCEQHARKALSLDNRNVQAHWVDAERQRSDGNIEAACQIYRDLAERYDHELDKFNSPWQLHWLGLALAQHARFSSDEKRFRQLTNQLYPRALSLEPDFWPAHCHVGELLLEKFNASDATAAFNDALRINPTAANAQVGLARLALNEFQLDRVRRHLERALQTNPNHRGALLCQADFNFAKLDHAAALAPLQSALALNPSHAPTLGRLAAQSQLVEVRPTTDEQDDTTEEPLTNKTVNQGELWHAWGSALELARRHPQAAARLRQAMDVQPQLLGPRGQLGMIEMRLGHETTARRLLDKSFKRDPYNVRVKNQLEVLDLLESYATIETEHFTIRYDAQRDALLAEQVARFVEPCYTELAETFGYELPEKALLEIFHDGRGVKAREWFGARMVGLPNIHTIAACGGNVVAMVSPTAERRKLNWADILRHEIVHLINVQQTDYAVPHWLTEGCAVWQEDRPRRPQWDKLLVERVPSGRVFDLDTLNGGFLRPRSADDWQLAYCQAEIYVQLIADQYGTAGVRRMLDAYRDNLPIDQAIAKSLNLTQAQLEQTHVKFLAQTVAQLVQRPDLQPTPKLSELAAQWQQNPTDLAVGANLALARFHRGDYPGAGRLVRQLLAEQPDLPRARLVRAKLLLQIGDEDGAIAELRQIAEVNEAAVQAAEAEAIKLLASIHLRKGNLDEAKQLYQHGAKARPDELRWTKALAVVALRQQNTDELPQLLTRIANAEPNNLVTRKKLLQLATESDNPTASNRWANEVLHIDPTDASARRVLRSESEKSPPETEP